ncbi:MAG: type I secretion protein, partial [Rhodobacteraceae bacterium]|nr:type I secretion protein [Paracoccaceae bacterium]
MVGTVEGTANDDIIDAAYANDPNGDLVDGGDAVLPGAAPNDDLIYGHEGDDDIDAGAGNDVVYGGQDDDEINGGVGDDTLYGDGGQDILWGDEGDDVLYGGAGDDTI